jgi:hypothetical protein
MAASIFASTSASDQEKYLADKLISRSMVRLVCASVLDPIQLPEGVGLTANFVRYNRMNVPLATLSEGVAPANSAFNLSLVQVTLDQWGDMVTISDVAQLTTKHPLVDQAIQLLSDNAQRVIDREIQLVWLAGTNIQYGDGSVTARSSITSGMKATDTVLHKARVTMVNNGAPPRGGPSGGVVLGSIGEGEGAKQKGEGTKGLGSGGSKNFMQGQHYVAIAGPEALADIQSTSTSLGTFASVSMYRNETALYNGEVGTWLGFRWVETNFLPTFSTLGGTTAAVATGNAFGTNTPIVTAVNGGGALTSATTFFFKVTRKSLSDGFEDEISIPHSMASTATGNNESFTFDFTGLATGNVYSLYFDTVTTGGTGTDATLGLVQANIAVGSVVTVTANPAATTNPPASVTAAGVTSLIIHPIYIVAEEFGSWVGLQQLRVMVSGDTPTIGGNELLQLKSIGYKFLGKAVIKDQLRILRLEVNTTY